MRRAPCAALGALLIALAAAGVQAQAAFSAARFSSLAPGAALPPEWSALTFRNGAPPTRYALVADGGVTVLKAEAEKSASGLIRRFEDAGPDLKRTPVLRWRWKVAGLIRGADIRIREGDDYPARVYVTFRYEPARAGLGQRMQFGAARALYGEYPPHAAISYVWDGRAALGTLLPNAYTARAMMLVVESGARRVGEWVEMERNVLEDYRRAFGEDPPPVSGIAVMTDTDQTGESATAWYGDIEFKPAP